MFMNLKWYHLAMLITIVVLLQSCSEFALIGSGTSLAISQNVYAKAYNKINVITIMSTEKDIKTHAYEKIIHDRKK